MNYLSIKEQEIDVCRTFQNDRIFIASDINDRFYITICSKTTIDIFYFNLLLVVDRTFLNFSVPEHETVDFQYGDNIQIFHKSDGIRRVDLWHIF